MGSGEVRSLSEESEEERAGRWRDVVDWRRGGSAAAGAGLEAGRGGLKAVDLPFWAPEFGAGMIIDVLRELY